MATSYRNLLNGNEILDALASGNFKNLSSPLSGSKMQSDYKDKIFHRNEINSRIK